jgi:hypothetical protein
VVDHDQLRAVRAAQFIADSPVSAFFIWPMPTLEWSFPSHAESVGDHINAIKGTSTAPRRMYSGANEKAKLYFEQKDEDIASACEKLRDRGVLSLRAIEEILSYLNLSRPIELDEPSPSLKAVTSQLSDAMRKYRSRGTATAQSTSC